MKNKIIDLVLKRPWLCIISSLLFVSIFVPGLAKIEFNFGSRIWYGKDDKLIKTFDEFERTFGNDEFVGIMLYHPEGIFTVERLQAIQKLTDKAWQIKDIIRVDSLSNTTVTDIDQDDILIQALMPDEISNLEQVEQIKVRALKEKSLMRQMFNPELSVTIIYARLRPLFEGNFDYQNILESTKKMILEAEETKLFEKVDIIGTARVTDAYREVANNDLYRIFPLMMLLVFIFLIWNFRSLEAIVLPMLILWLSVTATLGLGGLLGFKFNSLSSCIPGILLAITIADTVHLLSTFYKQYYLNNDFDQSIRLALEKNLAPTFMTSISTSIGFLSLGISDIIPVRDLGILSGFGAFLAWFLTIFFLPPIFKVIPNSWLRKTKLKTKKPYFTLERSHAITSVLLKARWFIVIVFTSIAVISAYLSTLNKVNSDPIKYFAEDVPVRQTYDFLREELKAISGPEIVVHSGVIDGVKDPVFLKKVDQFTTWLANEIETVSNVLSIVDVVKEMNQNFNNGDARFRVIPDEKNLIAQYLFLYSMNLPQGLGIENRVTNDFKSMRISLLWNIPDANSAIIQMDRINAKAKELGLNAYVSGQMPLYHRLNAKVVDTFFKSMALALILVSLFMIVIFKSFKMGFISMLPNFLPLLLGGGAMYLSGDFVDMSAAINYSVCLGVVVDDTIHFLFDYDKQRKGGFSISDSIARVFNQTAPALIVTTLILAVGFGLFMFSDFVPNARFGFYCAIIFIFALLIDIVGLPALMLVAEKKESK